MAKKKKKGTRRRSGGKKKRRSAPKAKPAGLAGGAALSGFEILYQPVMDLTQYHIADAKRNLINNATTLSNYKYALAGMLITASPKIPIVGIVARPVNKGLKRLTKGKWGL